MSEPRRPMSIWVTGEPVPPAARRRGSFADMIRATAGDAWPGQWSVVDVVQPSAELPAEGEVAGVIVTGSAARIADQEPWMRRVQDGLARLVESGAPVLGICFGHQLLGVALGGRSGPNPSGREIGTVRLTTHAPDPLLGDGPRSFPVSMTHLDAVLELPAGAAVLASSELDPCAAIRFGERAWGVQFHPEMDAEVVAAYVGALRERLRGEGLDVESIESAVRDTPESAEVLRRFARTAAEE